MPSFGIDVKGKHESRFEIPRDQGTSPG